MELIYTIAMLIPVILVAAFIIHIVKGYFLDGKDFKSLNIAAIVPAVVILMVAILVIIPMAQSTASYIYDADDGELTITKNVAELDVQPWDSYASEVRNLVIKDGVTIGAGAFDSLTSLEYVSIGNGVTVASGAFGGHVKDQYGQTIAQPSYGQYYGDGDGDVYVFDPDIFTYNVQDTSISGLADADAAYLVLPKEHNGNTLVAVGGNAFKNQTGIVKVLSVSDSSMSSFYTSAFEGCTSLVSAVLPDHLTGLGEKAFYGCTSLVSAVLPDTQTTLWASVFYDCAALESVNIPDALTTLGTGVFANCSSVKEFHFPATVSQIGAGCFGGCTGVTEVSFEEGFASTLGTGAFSAWTFYASDGTTVIEKTAAELAGKTFQGTAAALVEVAEGQDSLTPDQRAKVHLHDAELQDLKDQISIDPMPFQPITA